MNDRILQTTLLIYFLLLTPVLVAQGWEIPYLNGNVTTKSTDVLIVGDTAFMALGNSDQITVPMVKTDTQGSVIWQQEHLPEPNDVTYFDIQKIINTNDGGFAMTGRHYFTPLDHGIALYKLDAQGDTLWTGNYGCCSDYSNDLVQTSDGGYLIVGLRLENMSAVAIRADAAGTVVWDSTHFAVGTSFFPYNDGFRKILNKDNDHYLLFGSGDGQLRLTEIDDNGTVVTEQIIPNPDNYNLVAGDFVATPDGGLLVGATIWNEGGYLCKLDASYNILWTDVTSDAGDGVNSIAINDDGEFLIGRKYFIEKRDSTGAVICTLNEDHVRDWSDIEIEALPDGGAIASLSYKTDPVGVEQFLTLVRMDDNCIAAVDLITGNVNIDGDGDCIENGAGDALYNWLVELNAGNFSYYALSDTNGNYAFPVNAGTYDLTLHEPMSYWQTCALNIPVTVGPGPDTVVQNLQAIAVEECPFMLVDLATSPMRPCVDRAIALAYANLGPVTAQNAYIQVTLDSLISITAASAPYTALPNNVYQFDLGDVAHGDYGQIYFNAFTDCNAELGTTVCLQANIYPDTLCGEEMWDGAIIKVEGDCEGEDINFEIKNIGTQDMVAPLQYVVVEDHVMYMSGDFELDVGQSEYLTIPNQHGVYVARAEQEPGYPYGNFAVDLVAFCENPNITIPFSNDFYQFPFDDGAPVVDIECVPVKNSLDPNQKLATPAGYGDRHFIEANTPIEYHIDFQNTGNDTAYLVVIRDTLSEHLDIRTLRSGASSHDYVLDLEGSNVLVFTFNNINLVDSITNEAMSHGFVEYKIQQVADLPNGTEIENSAAIYFDFNAPIITNTTLHTIGEAFITVAIDDPYQDDLSIEVFPNPVSGQAFLQLDGLNLANGQMQLYNSVGQQMNTLPIRNNQIRMHDSLASGVYFFQIWSDGSLMGTGKLMIR